MNLSVMIIADDEGQRFLRIRTEKSAPLYASLENVLQPGVYYYDIVGPKLTINWETPAGELQGAQLTLKKRSQPNPDSYSLIYGTLSDPSQHQFPTLETLPHAHPPPPVVTTGTRTLDLNIRPSPCNSPANVSLTFAKNPAIHAPELDFPHLDYISPLMLPPPPCGPCKNLNPAAAAPVTQAHFVPVSDVDMDYLLNNQPLTDLGFRDTFEQTMSRRDTTFPKLQGEPSHRVGSPSLGLNKPQFAATSHVLQKEGVRNEGACALPQGKLSFSNLGAQEPKEHDESYVDVGGVSSSNSSNGPCGGDYIPHNHPMLIRFCNNPSTASTPSPSTPSPGFPSATTSSCATTTTASGRQRLGAQMFGSVSPDSNSEFPEDSSVFSDSFQGAERDNSGAGSDYMPHSFIQKQCEQMLQRSASVPVFPALLSMESDSSLMASSLNEKSHSVGGGIEEGVYVNHTVHHTKLITDEAEPMEEQSLQVENGSWDPTSGSSTPSLDTTRPPPCSYSSPFVGHSVAFVPSGSAPHQYFVLDHQGGSPQVGLRDTSPATADDGGYMDMSGSGRDAPMRSLQLDNGNLSPPVARTSLPAFLRLDSLPVDCTPSLDSDAEMELSLDSGMRKMSAPDLTSSASQPHLQPRNRRPIPEMMLTSCFEDPSLTGHYTYIDPQSVPDHPDNDAADAKSAPGSGAAPSLARRRRPADRAAPHRELSDSELQQVAGWCPTVTERTIESTMSRHVNEDGNFIVWRYSTGGKYVISVSHLRTVRHYAVYETEERDGEIYFYIFPRGFRSRSLAALVAHYQSNSMSEPTKTFRTPEGEVRRSGSSRLSHVRLRKPLTVRYGQESSRTKH
ncbi:hypothetical protein BaRGS_00030187 [Batillaria attramentaria]|uniref:SH2 domain-containing protein n=1 Tax=Batillaria attramentaria TaxID=370345 RepID=A0ABD0JVK6_9CAEN